MFIWRKRVAARTLAATEPQLRKFAGTTLALIEEPNRKTIIAEIAHARGDSLEEIRARFGGVIVQLPGDWLQKAQNQHRKPIKVGKRLIVARSRDAIATHPPGSAAPLIIPAGAAFGTGEHATTAMSLRLLEQLARTLSSAWSILDIGTGTGILALAARKFGARRVVAIDSDPTAISTAKANARFNGIADVEFRIRTARNVRRGEAFDVVAANLYAELLIEVLPLLNASWLILSGILRDQEATVARSLENNKLALAQRRRRGKWIALLASKRHLTR